MVIGMREKLIELLRSNRTVLETAGKSATSLLRLADHLIANGVTIPVRCKDCKCWCYEYDDVGLCVTDVPDIDGVQRLADDFCSYGERKGNGNDD